MHNKAALFGKEQDGRYIIPPEKITSILFSRPGLILGSGIVFDATFSSRLNEHVKTAMAIDGCDPLSLFATGDESIKSTTESTRFRELVREFYTNSQSSPQMNLLAKPSWSGVLSLCRSICFEESLRTACSALAGKPLRRRPQVVSQPTPVLEPQCFPIFKLIGSLVDDDFPIDTPGYKRRIVTHWRSFVPSFADHVKAAPILCIGFGPDEEMFHDLLTEMQASHATRPSALMFLADDPLLKSQSWRRYAPPTTDVVELSSTLSELANRIEHSNSMSTIPAIDFNANSLDPIDRVAEFQDVAVFVNNRIEPTLSSVEQNSLKDLLFQPTSEHWDPFAYDLDFPRELSQSLRSSTISLLSEKKFNSGALVLSGEAGTGKTTILKRLAFDLASADYPVLWMRTTFSQNGSSRIDELLKLFRRQFKFPLTVIIDNPLELSTISVSDVVLSASNHNIPIVLIAGFRESELKLHDSVEYLVGNLPILHQEELPVKLSDKEISDIPEYLCRLGVSPDIDQATHMLSNANTTAARDILCLLYLLLPQTRNAIESAITGEYVKLGDTIRMSQIVNESTSLTGHLDDVYAMVAVSQNNNTVLPVEILVHATDTDYAEWMDSVESGKPSWGFLYSEHFESGETVGYRTRNSLIAEIIVKSVNGGTYSRAGEVRILKRLLDACGGASPAYYAFARSVLVPHEKVAAFGYELGQQLYAAAYEALPIRDPVILHHNGIFEHKVGKNPSRALEILREALSLADYPYSSKIERSEHIRTSMAACVVTQLKQKTISTDMGKLQVQEHLDAARSESFFNPRAVHVQANVVKQTCIEIADDEIADTMQLASRSLSDIDRAVLILKTDLAHDHEVFNSVQMLEQARSEVIDTISLHNDLEEVAESIWSKSQRQEGFVMRARSLYGRAIETNKGKDYREAFDYANTVLDLVNKAGIPPIASLLEIIVHTYYRWRIRRAVFYDAADLIDWNLIKDLTLRINREHIEVDPFYQYLCALACSHLEDWQTANTLFDELKSRSMPRRIRLASRDLLLSPNGHTRLVQGRVRDIGGKKFLYVADLQNDFLVLRPDRWPSDHDATGYVEFSFRGPRAIKELDES